MERIPLLTHFVELLVVSDHFNVDYLIFEPLLPIKDPLDVFTGFTRIQILRNASDQYAIFVEIAELSVFTRDKVPILPVEGRLPKHEDLKVDNHSRYNDHYEGNCHFHWGAFNIQNGKLDQIVLSISI